MSGFYLWNKSLWERCLQEWGHQCAYCGKAGVMTQDHFIPLSHPDCPGTVPGNIVPACLQCNLSKGPLHPMDWAGPLAFAKIAEKLEFP